jgi:ribonuclease HI
VKQDYMVVLENSHFIIGDGSNVRFWSDIWCGDQPLAETLNVPEMQTSSLKVRDVIHNHQWLLTPDLETNFPNLKHYLEQIIIPLEYKADFLAWNDSDSGNLSLKQAYLFKDHPLPQLHWAKVLWCKDIPPSKSLVAWRLMHNKLPTDENLCLRGCNLPSVCNLCFKKGESSFHLFFQCPYAISIWNWFARIINLNLNFNTVEEIWSLYDRSWQPQCKVVILASIVNIISTIWYVRNQIRFQNKIIPWENAITLISANVSLSGNLTSHTYHSSMRDFSILKKFNVCLHPPKAPSIKEVIWVPPPLDWLKCNTDGALNANAASCGGVFRNHHSLFVVAFAEKLSYQSSFIAELCGVMRAIEFAIEHDWLNLWVETDSRLVVLAFSSDATVPWVVRNRWQNCKLLTRRMNFIITHIYREGNDIADSLANLGTTTDNVSYFWVPPLCIINSLYRNRLGLPSFRFTTY